MDAAVGIGLHADFPSAVKAMTHLGDTFEPNPATHAIYDEVYQGVYLKMYKRLQPLYQTIRKIGR
jgi:ribulose kinase